MNLVERGGLRLLVFPALEDAGFACAVSTIPLDVRRKDGSDRLVSAAGLEPERTVTPRQVHLSDIVRADAPLAERPDADGLVTDIVALPLVLRAADCSLVVVADPEHRAIGVAHAGWKGSARGVVVNLVRAMHEHYGSRPSRLLAGVGPTIRAPNYEVGPEVPAAFFRSRDWTKEYVQARDGRFYFDLPGANARFLGECGVPRVAIDECALCTFDRQDLLHSFRRDGVGSGHHGLVAAVLER